MEDMSDIFDGEGGEGDEPMDSGEEHDTLPPEFKAHASVALDPEADPEERMRALYDAIEACAGGGGGGHGLDVVIGMKPKQKR